MNALRHTIEHKKNMKKLFDDHIKKSGYVAPKFK